MQPFEALLEEAVAFHGHLCPGQVLGVRMAIAGCRALGIDEPKAAGKALAVFVEINRCAADALQSVTGCSLGRRNLWHLDYGKMAATFADLPAARAVRVVARDDARERVAHYVPGIRDARRAQTQGCRLMPDAELFALAPVAILPGWLDRRRGRVVCGRCGEGVNYGRETWAEGTVLCRPCAGDRYCVALAGRTSPAVPSGGAALTRASRAGARGRRRMPRASARRPEG